jgi:hypothetical protein
MRLNASYQNAPEQAWDITSIFSIQKTLGRGLKLDDAYKFSISSAAEII